MGRDSERVRVSSGRSSDRRRRHERRGSSGSDEDGEIPSHRDLHHRSGSSSSDAEIRRNNDLGRKIERRRHDSGSSSSSDQDEEQDLDKISKQTEREREREGRIHRGSRDRDRDQRRDGTRRSHEDDKEQEKKLTDRKKSLVNTDKERVRHEEEDRRRKHERNSLSDEEGEIQVDEDLRRKANRRRRHDSHSSSSDQEEDLKKKRNQNGEQRHRDHRRRDDKRIQDDDKEEKRKSLSNERARRSEDRYSDREKEKKRSERKQDDRHDRGRERDDGDRYRRRDNDRRRVTGEDKNHYRPRIPVKEWIEHDRRYDNINKIETKDTDKDNPSATYNVVNVDPATSGKSGGTYLPPFKLAQMMNKVEDKSSVEYQRLTWDALRKSINGLVNKVNATNIKNIITELFEENLIRGRGLFCRSCMKSQMASPGFTDVFSALVAVVNTKFPEVGELLLRRIVLQLKRAYKRNDKHQLLAAVKFVAHLVNQQVAHEILALELLTVLLDKISDDSVEVAVGFVTECGSLLQDLSPRGLDGIFERFRGILHEGEIDKRVQFLIEGLFAIRKAKFQGHPAVRPELDLVDQEDQLTHEISLDDKIDPETSLDIFKPDPQFLENEKRYEALVKNILGDESVKDEESSEESSDDEEDEDSDEEEEEQMKIKDETETNLVNLRRTIYLTIMSSVDFEEAGHKLLKIKLEPGQEMELCIMLLECCSQERTYLRYYGLLGQRFCMINKIHQENFEKCFVQQYSMIHRLETNKLRNVAKFFAHLLGTDALPWHVLSYIRLTEEDTTSSSRIFIKILFQELSEHLGIRLLNERLTDPTMQDSFESIFPKDNPKNSRFSINFFTSIGLGGITENLREYLKNMPRLIMQQQQPDPDSSSGSESSDESASSSSESEKEASRKRRRH